MNRLNFLKIFFGGIGLLFLPNSILTLSPREKKTIVTDILEEKLTECARYNIFENTDLALSNIEYYTTNFCGKLKDRKLINDFVFTSSGKHNNIEFDVYVDFDNNEVHEKWYNYNIKIEKDQPVGLKDGKFV